MNKVQVCRFFPLFAEAAGVSGEVIENRAPHPHHSRALFLVFSFHRLHENKRNRERLIDPLPFPLTATLWDCCVELRWVVLCVPFARCAGKDHVSRTRKDLRMQERRRLGMGTLAE